MCMSLCHAVFGCHACAEASSKCVVHETTHICVDAEVQLDGIVVDNAYAGMAMR